MENPDLNKRVTAPSITYILKKISDDKALVLFNSIAVSSSNEDRYIPLKEMNLSTKQYYSRISGLTDAGLVKRHKGRYSLTMLGKVIYESQMLIGKTLAYYWKLKAIESIEMSSSGLPNEDQCSNKQSSKDILMKPTSNPSIEINSRAQTLTAVLAYPCSRS